MVLTVLYLDNHCLAVDKPAGVLVQSDRTGDATLSDAVRDYLRAQFSKPGRVYLGVVHRLDRPVSGVVLFARTSKAASRLADAFRRGLAQKTYLAVVERAPLQPSGTLEHYLCKDRRNNRSRLADPAEPGARFSRLHYRVRREWSKGALLEVQPETGRSHQIRVQLAAAGAIIVGDMRYGSKRPLGSMIALHAAKLVVAHPTRDEDLSLESPLPQSWEALFST